MKKLFCVLMTVALLSALMTGCGTLSEKIEQVKDRLTDGDETPLEIDTIDKVNYYAGMKLLNEASEDRRQMPISHITATAVGTEYDPSLDSEYWYDDGGTYEIPSVVIGHDISMYKFRITKVIYFRISVAKGDYLADKIGTGKAEVVITDLDFGLNPSAMITFKNGDRFFSCLSEIVLQDGLNNFRTDLYIKDYEWVKDLTGDLSSFDVYVDLENSQVDQIDWRPFSYKPSEAPTYGIEIEENSVNMCDCDYAFYLYELDEYYNGTPDETKKKTEPEAYEETTSNFETELWDTLPADFWQ